MAVRSVIVIPGNSNNSHHVKIVDPDDGDEVGLICTLPDGQPSVRGFRVDTLPPETIKQQQGETQRADLRPDYSYFSQDDFSAGRGFSRIEQNRSGYNDAHGAFTAKPNQLMPGGLYQYGLGDHRNQNVNWPSYQAYDGGTYFNKYNRVGLKFYTGATKEYYAAKFTPSASYSIKYIEAIISYVGSPGGIVAHIYDDSGGSPNASQGSDTLTFANICTFEPFRSLDPDANGGLEVINAHVRWTLDTPVAVTQGVAYWVVWTHTGTSDENNYWNMLCDVPSIGASTSYKSSADGSSWSGTAYRPYFRVTDAGKDFTAHFARYRGILYAGLEYHDQTVSRIFKNGDNGVADAGSTTTQLDDATKSWSAETDVIVRIIDGPGEDDYRPWRLGDVSGTAIDFTNDPLPAAPDTTTIYAWNKTNTWTEITQSTTPGSVDPEDWVAHRISDMLSCFNMLYLPMGETNRILNYHAYNNSGVWTESFNEEQDNTRQFMDVVATIDSKDDNERKMAVWAADRASNRMDRAFAQDGTSGLASDLAYDDFTALYIGDPTTKINSIGVFGDEPHMWVFKEDGPFEIVDDVVYEFRSTSMKDMQDWRNGKANATDNVYLYWTFHRGVERWNPKSGELKHVGPDVIGDEGMPKHRAGYFADLVSFAGMLIGAYDAGEDGYSSILAWNNQGWHELFRAPWAGARITRLFPLSIEGDYADQLWFSCGADLMWIPVGYDPEKDQEWAYHWQPTLLTPKYDMNFLEVDKFFKKLTLSLEVLYDDDTWADASWNVYYRIDGGAWQGFGGVDIPAGEDWGGTMPTIGRNLSTAHDKYGQEIEFLLVGVPFYSGTYYNLTQLVIEYALRFTQKEQYTITFSLEDNQICLDQAPDPIPRAVSKYNLIKEFTQKAYPVKMSVDASIITADTYVLLEPASFQILNKVRIGNEETWVCQMKAKTI